MITTKAQRHQEDPSAEGAEPGGTLPQQRPPQDPQAGGATRLERLLALVRQGEVRSIAQLGEELRASPALVETMLEDLTRRGYLRRVEMQCGQACAGCAHACGCVVAASGRVWRVELPGGGG